MASANNARANYRRPLAASEGKNLTMNRLSRGRSANKSSRVKRLRIKSSRNGSRVGDDLVEAVTEMAKHLRGEIQLQAHEPLGGAMTPAQIKAIRLKVASSTKEFERLFGIPARTMEAYEQGRRNLDGAMRSLLRIIDREPKAALKALAA